MRDHFNRIDRLDRMPTLNELEEFHYAAATGDTGAIHGFLAVFSADYIDMVDYIERTALHHAAMCGQHEAVRVLLEHGASVTIEDDAGWTPEKYASWHGHHEALALLKEKASRVPKRSRDRGFKS